MIRIKSRFADYLCLEGSFTAAGTIASVVEETYEENYTALLQNDEYLAKYDDLDINATEKTLIAKMMNNLAGVVEAVTLRRDQSSTRIECTASGILT